MATATQQQAKAARRVSHLPPDSITCRYCGEQSAGGSFKGYAHRYGPTLHRFMANRPWVRS